MKHIIFTMVSLLFSLAVNAKPHCQGFNNYDDKVTIVFTDDNAGEQYTVADVKLIPTWRGQEYQATSVKSTVKDCVTTKGFSTVSLDTVTSPDIAIIEGKLKAEKVQKWAETTESRNLVQYAQS